MSGRSIPNAAERRAAREFFLVLAYTQSRVILRNSIDFKLAAPLIRAQEVRLAASHHQGPVLILTAKGRTAAQALVKRDGAILTAA